MSEPICGATCDHLVCDMAPGHGGIWHQCGAMCWNISRDDRKMTEPELIGYVLLAAKPCRGLRYMVPGLWASPDEAQRHYEWLMNVGDASEDSYHIRAIYAGPPVENSR